MAGSYRKARSRIRRPNRRKSADMREEMKIRRSAAKLISCAVIFAFAVFVKLIFPSAAAAAGDEVMRVLGEDIDYKAAILTLGEGLSGEKEFSDAVTEACAYAFAIGGIPQESTEVSLSVPETLEPLPSPEQDEETVIPEQEIKEPVPETPPEENTDHEPDVNEAVSAYLESIGEYADIELPEGVTYDMPEIGIECTPPALGTVTSRFGYRMHPIDNVLKFHYGTDIGAAEGTDIVAFADGTVAAAGDSTSLGKYLIISHANGAESLYAHCSELFVSGGETVAAGQKIAAMGSTGAATGSNLHFELTVNDVYVNPQYYVSWQ